MSSVLDPILPILFFGALILGFVIIYYLARGIYKDSRAQELEESYRAIKVCADGTLTEVEYNYHDISITNNTDADIRVTLDKTEYVLEPTAVFKGRLGQGHHYIKARNTVTNEIAKIGFTFTKPDTITISYVDGKLKFQ